MIADVVLLMDDHTLASCLIHEIAQPLCAIGNDASACIRQVQAGATPQMLLEDLNQIALQAQRAQSIIQWWRRWLHHRDLERSPVHIDQVVGRSIHLMQADLKRRAIDLRQDLAPGLPQVTGDAVQLAQVMVNLLQNAVDAMSQDGGRENTLMVRTLQIRRRKIRVEVCDSGCGLPPGASDRLFNPLVTSKAGHLGMGLAISRTIIDWHRGTIWCRRNPDRGATFGFDLPHG